MRITPRRFLLFLLFSGLALVLLLLVLLLRQFDASKLGAEFNQRTSGELIRYARVRLIGHELLETLLLPALAFAESQTMRPTPSGRLPQLGKGQQAQELGPLLYDAKGAPQAHDALSPASSPTPRSAWGELQVSTVEELARAMRSAKAGQTIVLNPGRYHVSETLVTGEAGQAQLPITVRAKRVGQVRLESLAPDMFRVNQPYWVFENLQIRGACPVQADCKRAFLVLGAARGTVLRNNLLEDFNAHLQVNGDNEQWPDEGLVQFNTFSNSRGRDSAMVVAPINIMGASKWKLMDNSLSHFVKTGGSQSSYGILIRGAGHGNRVERNVLVCTPRQLMQPGIRIGLSFGGPGAEARYCRDQRCEYEQRAGVAANNVLAHCNDFGIDVHRSASMLIAHNTLINTAGIDVRGQRSSATVYGNLLDGRVRERDGAQLKASMNEVLALPDYLEDPDALRLNWRRPVEALPSLPLIQDDFCGAQRRNATHAGALADAQPSCIAAVLDARSVPR